MMRCLLRKIKNTMKKIYPNLFIGSEDDYKFLSHDLDGWYTIHA